MGENAELQSWCSFYFSILKRAKHFQHLSYFDKGSERFSQCFLYSPCLPLLQPLDFETKSSFSLRIEATNRNIDSNFLNLGPFSDTTSVKVTVEDVNEPPVFSTPLSKMVVSEDAKVGTSIGRVSAHDPDNSNSPIRC